MRNAGQLHLALAFVFAAALCGRPAPALAFWPKEYLVVDVSAGPSASSYPVRHLWSKPSGGWTEAHKTRMIVLRRIHAGTYVMGAGGGATAFEALLSENIFVITGAPENRNAHSVTLTRDFYIGVFEVTQRQWERVMGTWPSYFSNVGCRDALPVEQVGYDMIRGGSAGTNWPACSAVDADSFMGRLREKTRLAFDLPTEAQWEYAGRAGRSTDFNTGWNILSSDGDRDERLDEAGRYLYNGGRPARSSGDGGCEEGTADVGTYEPNAWGLYDIHGNVWELCLDWYGDYPVSERTPAVVYKSWRVPRPSDGRVTMEVGRQVPPPADATDPKGPAAGIPGLETRVKRGGAWRSQAWFCTMTKRGNTGPDERWREDGFRLALVPGR